MIVVRRGWRFCADCRECLPTQQFYKRRQRSRSKRKNAADRWVTDSYCHPCRRARTREQYRRRMENPELRRREMERLAAYRQRRYRDDPAYRERELERHRRWVAGLPAWRREQMAQDARIRAALTRERRGLPLPQNHQAGALGAYNESRNTSRLDPGPLLEAIPEGWEAPTETLARRLYAIRHETERVSLAVVDEFLCALGRPHLLPVLYPA